MPTNHNYAHFGDGWYICWLVERRDVSPVQWLTANGEWTSEAWKANWFARHEDADAVAGEHTVDCVACDHAFAITVEHKPADQS